MLFSHSEHPRVYRPERFRKHAATLVAGVAVAALLAACGSSGGGRAAANTGSPAATPNTTANTDTAANTGGAPGSGATPAQLASAQQLVSTWTGKMTADSFGTVTKLAKTPDMKGKTVYLVPLSYTIPVIHGIVTGVQQALDKVGAKYKVCDGGVGGQPNPTNWGNCLKQAGDAKADAVMSFFIDYKAVSTQFDALAKAGIPTVITGVTGEGLSPKTGLLDVFDSTPSTNLGFANLSVLALATGGANTNILILRLLDSTGTTASSDAAVAKFKQICPDCGITTADFTTANSQAQLAAEVSAALVKNPAINMVQVPVDSYAPLIQQGIQQAGKTGKVQFVSGSGNLATFQRIKGGDQAATIAAPVLFTGWQFANALMQLEAGMPVEKGSADLAPARVINKDNVGTLDLSKDQSLTDQWLTTGQPYRDTFLTAWGISS